MKIDITSTFFTKLKKLHASVKLLFLLTVIYSLSACTGAGAGNEEVASLEYGLRLTIVEGDDQTSKAAETFPVPLKVKLTDTTGTPVQGVKVTFRQSGGSEQATILTKSVMTSSEGFAETRIKAPDKYDATFTVEALIEETNLITEFSLATTTTGTPSKIVVQTSHGEIEQAGVPFSYVFRLTDEADNTVRYNGTLTLNLTVNTPAKSWAGNEPVRPPAAITCLFADGICSTASVYTLTSSEQKTYLTVNSGSMVPDVNKEVTVLPSAEFQVIITDKAGGPATSATAVGAFESSTVLNTDMPAKDFYAAIVDTGGNFLRDADASDNIVWSAVRPNGTSFTEMQSELTPQNGGGSVHYSLIKTVIPPNTLRIRATKTGINSDETGNIQVDPGTPATFKLWTQHNGVESTGSSFNINGSILDAKGNICAQTPTKAGISGSATGNVVVSNDTFGSVQSIKDYGNNGLGSLLNFFNGNLIPLLRITLTKGQKDPSLVTTKPTISINAKMDAIEYITDGFDLTGVTDPIIVNYGAPRRLSFRSDTGSNGNYADDMPCNSMSNQFYNDSADTTNTFYGCADATAGTVSRTLYAVVEDRGGNPLKWTGTAWEMTDLNGTPEPTVIDTWGPTGASIFNFSPVNNVSHTVFNPTQAGYSSIKLKLVDATKGVSLTTTYSSQITTGEVATFWVETTDGAHGSNNLISAPNSFTMRIWARDATGNTVYSFNGAQTFTVDVSPLPATSPKGTAANFPSSMTANFTAGYATISSLRLPNAKINKTTVFQISTVINSQVKTSNAVTMTVDVGSVDSLKIRNAANDTGDDLSATPLTFSVDSPPTLITASYDAELNFYRDEIATWSVVGTPLNTSISLNTLAQSNPITPQPYGAGNNQGTIKATVGSRNVSTGQVSIVAGAFQQITVTPEEAVSGTSVSTAVAGKLYKLRIAATDQYYNKITTFNGSRNLVFTTSGNGATRKGYTHSLPTNASYSFVNGEVSPLLNFRLYNSDFTPRIIVDETTSVPTKTGSTNNITVENDVPYNFLITRSTLYLDAGQNANFGASLQDTWGNKIQTGGQQNAAVKFYFNSSLGGTDILSTNLGSSSINHTTDEATGTLNNGGSSYLVTATQAGTLKPNIVLQSGALPNANEISDIIVQPLTTVDQIRWVTGSVPQTTYTASKSVPFNEFKVEAVDIYGNRVTTEANSITLSVVNPSSGTAGTIIGTATKSLDNGVINFTDFKYPRAHNMTIRATHSATGKIVDANVAVSAGLPNQALTMLPGQSLIAGVATAAEAVTGSPSTQVVNVSYPIDVYIVDEVFNPVLTWGNTISIGITDDTGAVISPAATNFVNGKASFTVTSHKQGSHQIIPNASSILNNLASSFFIVNPGAPTRLVAVFPTQTLNQGASTLATAITTGSSLDQIAGVSFGMTVYATDNFFNIVTDNSTVVSLTLNNDPLATYGSSLPLVNGSVNFPTIRYLKATPSTQIGINVVSSTYTYSQIHGSSPFDVNPNTATQSIPYIPSYQTLNPGQLTLANARTGTIPNIKAGTNLTVRVAVTDNYYNPVPSYVTPFTLNMSDPNVPTPGNITPSNGEAIFSSLQWITVSSAATATANASGITDRALTSFNVITSDGRQTVPVLQGQTFSPGKFNLATAVTWTAGAQTRTAGVSYTVDVYLVDDYYNVITTATDTVGINLTTDGSAPAISSKSLVAGTASYTVTNTKADPSHTLKATSSFTNVDSTTFTVVPASAYQTAIFLPGENYNPGYTTIGTARTSTPNTQTAGTSFTATIRVLDQYFNVVNTSGSFTITRNDVNSTMTTTSNFVNGVGTAVITNYTANNVNNLTLSGTGYAVQHSSSTYIVFPESTRYLITALDDLGESVYPGKLTYAQAVSGTLISKNADEAFIVTVSARDKYFNLINDSTTVSITSPTDPFAILPAAKPLSNGSASFIIKNRKARNHYLVASGSGYTPVNSNNYFINWLAAENLVVLLPGQTLNSGASTLNINSTTSPNAIIGTPSVMTSGQSANINVYVTDKFFNQVDSTAGTYAYTFNYNDDPYAVAPSSASIVSATASFNYLPLRATLSQRITPVLTTGSIANVYTTPLFRVYPGLLNKTEVLLPNQTLIQGTASRTVAMAYPSSYTTSTDSNFNVTVNAVDAQHNIVASATSTFTMKDQADPNQMTYSGTLVSGTATVSVEPVTPGTNHYFQVITAPSIAATHAASDLYDITIGTPSKIFVQFPGQTFTPARRLGLQGLSGTITNQTVGVSFSADVIVTDSKFNVSPVAWNINPTFVADNFGSFNPSTITTTNGSATITVFNQVASGSQQIRLTPSSGALTGVPFTSASYVALPGAAEQTILVLTGQTHTPGPTALATAVTGTANTVTAGNSTSGTMKLVDHYFNVVSSNAAGASLSDDIESAHISPASTSFTNGIANFTITPIRDGAHTVSTAYAGVATHHSGSLTVVPGAATQTIAYFNSQTYQNGVTTLAAAVSGSAPAITADDTVPVNIRVVDNYYNTVTSFGASATLTTSDPVDTEPTTTISSGVGSANISPVRASAWTVGAAVSGKTTKNTNYTVTHGAAYQLVVKLPDQTFTPGQLSIASAVTPVTPADRQAGTAFNASVYLTDAEFNTATTAASTVNAAWVNDSNGLINTTTPLALVSGAGIINVTPKLAGSARKVRVTPTVALGAGSNFDSSAFNVTPATPARILAVLPGETFTEGSASLTGTPTTQTAGNSFNVKLYVTDSYYNTVSNYTGTLSLSSTDYNFSNGGSLAISSGSAASGTISVLSNTKTGVDTSSAWKITPTSTNMSGITAVDSSFYAVNANVPAKIQLALDTQTYLYNTTTHAYAVSGTVNASTAGSNYSVTAYATDASNNPTTDNSIQVGLTTAYDSYAVISSATTLTGGTANLTVNHRKAGSGYVLASTTTPSMTSVNSAAYTVNPGAAYTLAGLLPGESISAPGSSSRATAITGTPVSQTAGTAFTFTAKLVDQYYNAITSSAHDSKVISLTLNNDSIATTPSNLNLTNGVASFSVTNKMAGSNLSITAATTGLTQNSDTTNNYTVLPDTVSQLLAMLPGESHNSGSATLTGSPSTINAGTSFAVTVRAVDQFYNLVSSFSGAKALSFTTTAQNSPNNTAPALATNTNYTFTNGETSIAGFKLYKAVASSGTITVALASPALSKATSAITVVPRSTVASIKVRDAASNGGNEVTTAEYSSLDTDPTFYVAAYDSYGNYKSDLASSWTAQRTVAGDMDASLSSLSGTSSTQLDVSAAGAGSVVITATGGGETDSTGTITITDQGAHHFLAELESAGTKTADSSFNLKVTALKSNSTSATTYAGVKSISLSTTALSGVAGCTSADLNPELPTSATFTSGVALIPVKLKKAQTGVTISAQTSTVASGTTAGFNVAAGAAACLEIRTAASGTGSAISSTVNLSAFQDSVVYAHGYDANMNSAGDQVATWTASGTISNYYYAPNSGSSTWARVNGSQSGNGTLTATVGALSQQVSYSAATGGATLSSSSTDLYGKNHLLSNAIKASYRWNISNDETTGWRTNSALSWYTEAASCGSLSYRGCRPTFPNRVYIAVTDQEISIIDASTLDLFMRFTKGAGNMFSNSFGTAQSVTARNGFLYVGFTNGLLVIDFANDYAYKLLSGSHERASSLSTRNSGSVSYASNATIPAFANYNFKELKTYYSSSINYVIAGQDQSIQVIKNNAGTVTVVNGPTLSGSLTALELTSIGGIYYGESGVGVHFAQPNYSSLVAFSVDSTRDVATSDANDIHVETDLSAAQANKDVIHVATQDGVVAIHDHSTAASRAIYNYGLATDGLTGFNSYLRHTSTTVSGAVSIADHAARPSTDVTVEFFFKPETAISGVRQLSVLVDKANGTTDNDFGVLVDTDSSITLYTIYSATPYTVKSSSTSWNAQQWYHVVGQINSSGKMSLWIDGVLQGTNDIGVGLSLSANTSPVRLYSNAAMGNSEATNFSFDELRISDSARYTYNAATISVPTTAYTNDGNTSYLLHFDSNSVADSSTAAAAVTVAANGTYVVKPFFSGSNRAFTSMNAYSDGSAISGHVISGDTGKLIELRNMQNPSSMSEDTVSNSSSTLSVEYFNKSSATNFDFIQWKPGTGMILWSR